jgi:hypothetical protein
MTRHRCRPWRVLGSCALGTFALSGCGRRATEADCQLIVDKSVDLQLKQMSETDAPSIRKREQEVRTALEGEIKSCEGRRVTERTMACVQAASTAEELDTCLR